MSKLLNLEIKKSIFSKAFLLGLVLLSIFAVISGVLMINEYGGKNPQQLYEHCMENGKYLYNPDFPLFSFLNAWVGGETTTVAYTLFFTIMPVCTAIPFAWSYHNESKNSYIINVATRINIRKYFIAKAIAVFVSGALVVFLAFALNILIVSAFIPYCQPWAGYNFYNLVYFDTMWSDLFFSNPYLHMLLFISLNTLYGGIFALLSYVTSFYVKKYVVILFAPFLTMILAGYLENVIYNNIFRDSMYFVEFVPTQFLHSRSTIYQVMSWSVATTTLLLVGFIFISICVKVRKNEIY